MILELKEEKVQSILKESLKKVIEEEISDLFREVALPIIEKKINFTLQNMDLRKEIRNYLIDILNDTTTYSDFENGLKVGIVEDVVDKITNKLKEKLVRI